MHSISTRTESVEYRIVVVNQGEPIPSLGEIDKIINIPTNIGYIKATNIGLSEVKEGEDVLLLNDDCVIIDSNWLQILDKHLNDSGGTIGGIAPRMSNVIGKQNILYPLTANLEQVKWLVGACTLIKSEAFHKVGLLDERFGIGMQDDLDYSIRLRREGYSLWIDNTVFVYHIGSTTFKRLYTPNTWALMERDTRQQLIDKWGMAIVEETLKP